MPETPRRPGRPDPLGLLGIARRAGGVLQGIDAVRRGVKSGDAELVILAADAAGPQLEKVLALLRHHEVPCRWAEDREVLGRAIGSAPVTAVAVTMRSLAEELREALPRSRGGAGSPRRNLA